MDNVKKNDFIPYKDVGLEVARYIELLEENEMRRKKHEYI